MLYENWELKLTWCSYLRAKDLNGLVADSTFTNQLAMLSCSPSTVVALCKTHFWSKSSFIINLNHSIVKKNLFPFSHDQTIIILTKYMVIKYIFTCNFCYNNTIITMALKLCLYISTQNSGIILIFIRNEHC